MSDEELRALARAVEGAPGDLALGFQYANQLGGTARGRRRSSSSRGCRVSASLLGERALYPGKNSDGYAAPVIELRLREGQPGDVRCALCHDRLGAERVACIACSTLLHPECRSSTTRCPTLGCRLWPAPRTRRRERPRPSRLPYARTRWRRAGQMAGGALAVVLPRRFWPSDRAVATTFAVALGGVAFFFLASETKFFTTRLHKEQASPEPLFSYGRTDQTWPMSRQ